MLFNEATIDAIWTLARVWQDESAKAFAVTKSCSFLRSFSLGSTNLPCDGSTRGTKIIKAVASLRINTCSPLLNSLSVDGLCDEQLRFVLKNEDIDRAAAAPFISRGNGTMLTEVERLEEDLSHVEKQCSEHLGISAY
jgi:hypothetical protein